jgi:hypothetical protein
MKIIKNILLFVIFINAISKILSNKLKKQNTPKIHQFSDDDLKKTNENKSLNLTQIYNSIPQNHVDDKIVLNSPSNHINFATTSSNEKIVTTQQNQNHTIYSNISENIISGNKTIINSTKEEQILKNKNLTEVKNITINSKPCEKKNSTIQNEAEEIVHYIYNTVNTSNKTSYVQKSNKTDNFDGPLILSIVRDNENVKVQNTNTENINSHNTYNIYSGPKRKQFIE